MPAGSMEAQAARVPKPPTAGRRSPAPAGVGNNAPPAPDGRGSWGATFCQLIVVLALAAAAVALYLLQREEMGRLRAEIHSQNEVMLEYRSEIELRKRRATRAVGDPVPKREGALSAEQEELSAQREAVEAFEDIYREVENQSAPMDMYRWLLRVKAREELNDAGQEVVTLLMSLAMRNSSEPREQIASEVGKFGGTAAAHQLLKALSKEKALSVREAAARACGDLAATVHEDVARRTIVESLASAMLTDKNTVKAAAARSLGYFGASGPLPSVVRSVLDQVRYDAPRMVYEAAEFARVMINERETIALV